MTKLTYKTYLPLAKVTEGPYDTFVVSGLKPYNAARLLHMALGLATEALELQSSIARKLPVEESTLELSDICWFSALACEELGYAPDEAYQKLWQPQGIQKVYDKCEEFASRVKAGLVYGSPVKKSDPTPDYWKTIPAEIFGRTLAIGNNLPSGCILTININKLRARYGEKFSAHDALNRDVVKEAKKAFASEQGRPEDLAEILEAQKEVLLSRGPDGVTHLKDESKVMNLKELLG